MPNDLPLPTLDRLHAEAPRETLSDQMSREAGPVSAEEARDALGRFNTSHWNSKGEKARYSIPANPRRDDDIRLGAFIDQSEKRIALLEQTLRGILEEKRSDLRYHVHCGECHEGDERARLVDQIAELEATLAGAT